MLLNQIKSSQSKEEVRKSLAGQSQETRHELLSTAIDSINNEIEQDIASGDVHVAIFKMSQVVMLEDECHIVERNLLKQRVLA